MGARNSAWLVETEPNHIKQLLPFILCPEGGLGEPNNG